MEPRRFFGSYASAGLLCGALGAVVSFVPALSLGGLYNIPVALGMVLGATFFLVLPGFLVRPSRWQFLRLVIGTSIASAIVATVVLSGAPDPPFFIRGLPTRLSAYLCLVGIIATALAGPPPERWPFRLMWSLLAWVLLLRVYQYLFDLQHVPSTLLMGSVLAIWFSCSSGDRLLRLVSPVLASFLLVICYQAGEALTRGEARYHDWFITSFLLWSGPLYGLVTWGLLDLGKHARQDKAAGRDGPASQSHPPEVGRQPRSIFLLAVILIDVVLVVTIVGFPLVSEFRRSRDARWQTYCKASLRHLSMSAIVYAYTHGEHMFPRDLACLLDAVPDLAGRARCLADPVPLVLRNGVRCSYESAFDRAAEKGKTIPDNFPSSHPMIWERGVFHQHGKRTVAFFDGHNELVEESRFAQLLKDLDRRIGELP